MCFLPKISTALRCAPPPPSCVISGFFYSSRESRGGGARLRNVVLLAPNERTGAEVRAYRYLTLAFQAHVRHDVCVFRLPVWGELTKRLHDCGKVQTRQMPVSCRW